MTVTCAARQAMYSVPAATFEALPPLSEVDLAAAEAQFGMRC